ncbi:DUF2125 domain-containing protein [Pseudoruegeria sp. SK021]|uniref:DUF2125 domain-containing protein n=1 Tax=Pseudoruegeria sp. SK021 TaxID=1933035 RepID=UPI000A2316E4|nr:DUF2125 domain-containing protein [Pseudoruegeria sp. SK021]OSP56482.1 hypothetical protein BV911_00520 [Pseudoruegeria sp. SK021]
MRILLAVIILAALGWTGYWFIGARTAETAVQDWLAMREAEGWVVSASDVSTGGFPYRFDTSITDLDLADPDTGLAWRAPLFQILALSYNPNHVLVFWPERQSIATPLQTITVTSNNMRGSAIFHRGSDLELDHATIEFDTVGLVSTLGWNAALDHGQFAIRQTPVSPLSYDIALDARDLILPDRLTEPLRARGMASDTVQTLKLDATVTFDAPWDRLAIEQRRPQPTRIKLTTARASWGELDLQISGDLAIDPRGTPSGEITIKARNWKDMLQLARNVGAIPDSLYPIIESGLSTLARLSGSADKDTITAPLTLRDGRVTLGGLIPLGPTPRMILR